MVMNGEQLDRTFGALADATRRGMLLQLRSGEQNVSELAEPYSMSQPAISKHLRVLERAGLIERRRVGRNQLVKIRPELADEAADWIQQYTKYWKQRFDAVQQYIDQAQTKGETRRG